MAFYYLKVLQKYAYLQQNYTINQLTGFSTSKVALLLLNQKLLLLKIRGKLEEKRYRYKVR